MRTAALHLQKMLDLKAFGSVEGTMFIAMNHFKVRLEKETEFKNRWLEREVLLNTASGFLMIQFMRGNVFPDYVAYASQTVWTSREAYEAWRKSELFHAAHKGVGSGEDLTLEKRAFSSYEVLRTIMGQEQAA